MNDQSVFEDIYREHYSKVFGICFGYTSGNEALAKDLSQDVFIKVFDNYRSFRNESKISTWIFRIAVNTCYQYLKKRKPISANIQMLDMALEETEDKESKFLKMNACIERLNDENRSIILLELEDIPQIEIAQIIGISHQSLRTRIHRIKEQLSKCVKNERI